MSLYYLLLCGIIAKSDISSFTVGPVLCRTTSQLLQTPVLIFPVPQLGFVQWNNIPTPKNGGLLLLLPPFNLESSHVQPRTGIQPVNIVVINLPLGVASLSILEIRDLVTFHQ